MSEQTEKTQTRSEAKQPKLLDSEDMVSYLKLFSKEKFSKHARKVR